MTDRVLILGVGQDASFLADLLLEEGREVHLLHRRSSSDNLWRVRHLEGRVRLHLGDMADPLSVERVIREVRPAEIYNEADQDHVGSSFATAGYSADVTYGAVARTLETVRLVDPSIRFFQPLSATVFGAAPPPQHEQTPFAPQSPYACAKAGAYYLCRHYRREYGLHVTTAILFNHDSVRRRGDYLLHKVCRGAARIAAGGQETLALGDLAMRVDVGCAREYMAAVLQLLRLPEAGDYVLSSGRAPTLQVVVDAAFRCAGVRGDWSGSVRDDSSFRRPGPAPRLIGDREKAHAAIGWAPKRYALDVVADLVEMYRKGEA